MTIDLTGKRIGRLTVQYRNGSAVTPNGTVKPLWHCTCSCGKSLDVRGENLRTFNTLSCGCFREAILNKSERRHGLTKTKAYGSWRAMRSRCNNPTDSHYRHYGGRGIKICDRWNSFVNFYADMGDRPAGHTLDRIDNDKGYEPANCRWATNSEQQLNKQIYKIHGDCR